MSAGKKAIADQNGRIQWVVLMQSVFKQIGLVEVRRPTHRRIVSVLLAVTVVLLWTGFTGAQASNTGTAGNGNSVYGELAKAPAKAQARRNPLEQDRDAVLAGEKLYEIHCAECHGETAEGGKGSKKGPSLRADPVQQATPGTLFWLLTNGVVRRGMPVWSKLPEPQRWQLVSYIKSLSGPPKSKAEAQKALP